MNSLNSPGPLKVALAVSVALNLFAVAGGVTVWVTKTKAEHRMEAARAPGREAPFREIVAGMDPEVRDRIRTAFRASAMAARPDFEESRAARRQAVELTRGETLDPAVVDVLLDRSRAAEMRGRSRLEHDATALLATLEPRDRQALAVILSRRGKGGGGKGANGGPQTGGPAPGDQERPPHGQPQGR